MKDWELARNIEKRAERVQLKLDKRFGKWGKEYYGPVAESGPFVRTPLFKQVESRPDTSAWHKRRVMAVFNELDEHDCDEVGIDQLEGSFSQLQVPIDSQTFTLYAAKLLPVNTDYVSREEFLKFHQVVWDNQPASVRRFAGDPSVVGDLEGSAPILKPMQRSSSAPTMGASLKEVRDNERMVRTAFKRYQSKPGFLPRKQLPALFQDIGLDPGIATDLGFAGSSKLNTFLSNQLNKPDVDEGVNEVSVHDFIEVQNRYIAKLECTPPSERTAQNFVAPKYLPALGSPVMQRTRGLPEDGEADEALMIREAGLQDKMMAFEQYSDLIGTTPSIKTSRMVRAKVAGVQQEEGDPTATKARKALEKALLGVDPDDPELDESKERARHALMAVLDDVDEEEIEQKARARDALERTLLGMSSAELDAEEEEEDEQRVRAQAALEMAMFGKSSAELDEEEEEEDEQRVRAQEALEMAMFGKSSAELDEEEEEEDEIRDRAQIALERSLLGLKI